jgi:hypothetical protein
MVCLQLEVACHALEYLPVILQQPADKDGLLEAVQKGIKATYIIVQKFQTFRGISFCAPADVAKNRLPGHNWTVATLSAYLVIVQIYQTFPGMLPTWLRKLQRSYP